MFFLKEQIFCEKGCRSEKKPGDGRTKWTILRNEKMIIFRKKNEKNSMNNLKIFEQIFTLQTNFQKIWEKNYSFLLNKQFFGTKLLKSSFFPE